MATRILDLPAEEYMLPGNRACAGCGLGIGLRHILKAFDGKCIMAVPASCLTVLGGMYPSSSVRVPWMNVVFPSTAAAASGLVAGLKATGREDIPVLAMAGDGGTADIGIQALSGAAERNTNFIYICYDNEAYMNTGTQRSGLTPLGVRTTTTPVQGKQQIPKDMPRILEAHGVPYIATACPSFPTDLYDKVKKAIGIRGTRYLHLATPCPAGWQYNPKDTVEMGRLAVETGSVVLFEIENGMFRLTSRSKKLAEQGELMPVREYMERQGRYKNLDEATIAAVQEWIDRRWADYVRRDAESAQA